MRAGSTVRRPRDSDRAAKELRKIAAALEDRQGT